MQYLNGEGGSRQSTLTKRKYVFILEIIYKNMKFDKQFQKEALPLKLWMGYLGDHLHCSPVQVAMHESLKET
jgi:hypothetical protein